MFILGGISLDTVVYTVGNLVLWQCLEQDKGYSNALAFVTQRLIG